MIQTVSVVCAENHTTMWMMKMDFGLGVISVIDGIAVSVKALWKNQILRLTYARNVNNTLYVSLFITFTSTGTLHLVSMFVSFPLLHALLNLFMTT